MKVKTVGVSPKVIVDALVSVIAYLLTAGVIDIDPALAAAISKALGSLAAVIASPGAVKRVE